jgi:hypothetical protein
MSTHYNLCRIQSHRWRSPQGASRSRGAGAGRSERLPVPAHPRARDNAERVFITQPSCRPASGDGGLRAWASHLAPPVHAKSAIVRLGRAGRSPSSYTATRGVGSASHGAAHPPKTGLYNCRQYARYVDSRFAQNAEYRQREYLTEGEIDSLIAAVGGKKTKPL